MDKVDNHFNYFLWLDTGLDVEDRGRPKFKFGFVTYEEWNEYKHKEMLWTAPQLRKFWAAHTKEERDHCRKVLYDVRKQFYNMWFTPNPTMSDKILA